LPGWVERRQSNAQTLKQSLSARSAIAFPGDSPHQVNSYYRLSLLIDPDRLREDWPRNRILAELNTRGIPARVGACPDIGQEPVFRNRGEKLPSRPHAAWVGARSFVLPVHPTLTEDDLGYMADQVREIVASAAR
ncbi:MAG: DegT/DnrJ/EryC1/StrS aminotransferase family protein, partial [Rhodobacteraceae bacterium]|nr:DegT/DnrJ/EryC1/StrS aminotransferase family protein [Paracoccaceae bacterium]